MASATPTNTFNAPLSTQTSGLSADYSKTQSTTKDVYTSVAVCLPIILVFAFLRFLARWKLAKGRPMWSDFIFGLAVIFSVTYISTQASVVGQGGYGTPQWRGITRTDFSKSLLAISIFIAAFYPITIWLIKLSLLILFLEIFTSVRWLKWAAIVGSATTGCFYLAMMCLFAISCSPRSGQTQDDYFEAAVSEQCSKTHPWMIATGAFNVASDCFLVGLPLPAVWALRLPLRRKIAVSAVFFTAILACVASGLSLVCRIYVSETAIVTWAIIPPVVTSMVEMTAGIAVCSMPMAWGVLKSWHSPIMSKLAFRSKTLPMATSEIPSNRITENSLVGEGKMGLAQTHQSPSCTINVELVRRTDTSETIGKENSHVYQAEDLRAASEL